MHTDSSTGNTADRSMTTSSMAFIAVITAITCVLAPFSLPLPFSPVPITLTNFIILLAACLIGWRDSFISVLLYLLLGIAGLPVFSGFGSGIAKVVGPTGGYLIGFLPLAIAAGMIFEHVDKLPVQIIGLFVSTVLVLYLPGTAWLAFQGHLSFYQALLLGVIPYIPGDLIKIILAVTIGPALKRSLKKAGLL